MKRILMLMLIVCLGVGFMPNSMAFASNEEADVQTILDNMTTQ